MTNDTRQPCDIVPLRDSAEYEAQMRETVRFCAAVAEQLGADMVNLACLGRWRQWSDAQPIGTTFRFTGEMIRETGDANVDALLAVYDALERFVAKNEKYCDTI